MCKCVSKGGLFGCRSPCQAQSFLLSVGLATLLFLLPLDLDLELSCVCLHANMFLTIRMTDETSETVSKPQLKLVSFIKVAIITMTVHSNRTLTTTRMKEASAHVLHTQGRGAFLLTGTMGFLSEIFPIEPVDVDTTECVHVCRSLEYGSAEWFLYVCSASDL